LCSERLAFAATGGCITRLNAVLQFRLGGGILKRGMRAKTVAKKTKKKASRGKKTSAKKSSTKKSALRAKPARGRKTAPSKKAARAKKPARSRAMRHAAPAREISSGSERSTLGSGIFEETAERPTKRGLGDGAAGQSGDLQGLPRSIDVDSESVEELIEEGQSFEADAISGVENAPDADQGEVRVHERPEDELPFEPPEE